jgi:hypothetical protein
MTMGASNALLQVLAQAYMHVSKFDSSAQIVYM